MSAMQVLSLGAGVQSTCVLLMSIHGDLPRLDRAVFSDTGWEPQAVYEHLARLKELSEGAGIPVDVVGVGDIREDHADPQHEHLFIRKAVKRPEFQGKQRTFMPLYLVAPDGTKGIARRTCTKTYKIEPVERRLRELLGLTPGQRWPLDHRIDQWFGISLDETIRMKDSPRPAIVNRYPLVDLRMTRDDCHAKMAEYGWAAPRSACVGCPYHRNEEWRRMRDEDPAAWADAIEFDEQVRARQAAGLTTLEGMPFLHDSRVPLAEAAIDAPSDDTLPFGDECEGMCGV